MTRIVVDPEALAGAGRAVTGVGDKLATAVGTLTSSLGGGAPSGLDAAGLAFGMAYQKSAQALLDAGAALTNASRNVGFGVGISATNYSQADAASTVGGGGTPLTAPETPAAFDTPSSPSSLGGGVMPPFLWSVLENFIPDSWPDGNPVRLRASAEAWQSFGSAISGIDGELSGPSGVIAGQQIPEGGAMTSAISELTQSSSDVATEAGNLATQTRDLPTTSSRHRMPSATSATASPRQGSSTASKPCSAATRSTRSRRSPTTFRRSWRTSGVRSTERSP